MRPVTSYSTPCVPRVPTWDITKDELLTWELQLKREGTLPPDVQRRLLEHITGHVMPVPA